MIYLDHHATTPVDPRGARGDAAVLHREVRQRGEPQSPFGWEAQRRGGDARASRSPALIGADAKEIVFTSGATEANNLALKGVVERCARRAASRGHGRDRAQGGARHLPRAASGRAGETTVLPVSARRADRSRAAARAAITDRTALVSVMAANNEIGVLQPIAEIGAIAHAKGALFHTDAVQAIGKVPFDVTRSASTWRRSRRTSVRAEGRRRVVRAAPQAARAAGRRSRRRRARARHAVGHAERAGHRRLRRGGVAGARRRWRTRGQRLARAAGSAARRAASGRSSDLVVNGALEHRLPGNLNVSFPGVDGEALLVSLCEDIAVSSGAACTAAEPSHVLMALGRSTELALASLRFGLGRGTTEAEIDEAIARVGEVVNRLRAMARCGPASRALLQVASRLTEPGHAEGQ